MKVSFWLASLMLIALASFIGCSNKEAASPPAEATAEGEHDHSGWWCAEHGVPEEVCTRCNATLVAKFKEAGDWCAEHDLPDSQCFVCHPEHEATFAAQYEAKYGEQPPKPTE